MTRITAPSPTPSSSPTEQSDVSYVPSERSDTTTTSPSSFEGPYNAHLSNRWTSQEEEVLFDCVARHPRGGWPLIADDFDAKMSMGMDEGSPQRVRRTIGAMQSKYQSMRGEMVRRALAVQRMEKRKKEEKEEEAEAKEEPWHKRLGKAMGAFNKRSSIAGPSASTAASPERMDLDESGSGRVAAGGRREGGHGQSDSGSKEPATGSMALSKWQTGVQGEQRGASVTADGGAMRDVSRSAEA